jgi:hypothetical protein
MAFGTASAFTETYRQGLSLSGVLSERSRHFFDTHNT